MDRSAGKGTRTSQKIQLLLPHKTGGQHGSGAPDCSSRLTARLQDGRHPNVGRKEYERDRMLEEILPLQAQSAANVHYWWHDAGDVQSHEHKWLKNEDLVGFGERRHTEFVRGIGSWTIRVKRQLRKFFKGFTNGAWGYVS